MIEPTLEVLFDSPIRVRLLKLFLFSPDRNFDGKTIAEMLNVASGLIKKHLAKLSETRFVIAKKIGGKRVFKINKDFIFYEELKELVVKASPASKQNLLRRLKSFGGVKLAALSGIFLRRSQSESRPYLASGLNLDNSHADLLVVGDKIKSAKFDRFLKELEAEVGREINCALMTTKEFYYRYNMYDRFVRDILDFKHEKLINKLKI